MFRIALLVGLAPGLAGFAAADDKKDDAVAKEWKALDGKTFTLTQASVNGKEDPLPKDQPFTLTFKTGKVAVASKDETIEGELKLDPTKTPKEFTATFDKKYFPEPIRGIYEYKGDKFKVGVGTGENPIARPKDFDKAVMVLVFTEQKPKK
jgi:uncharacterized protein (TIGR03067 family)